MTATRPQRYDQCDDTCTVDCGHCKGKGRPDPLADLRERLLKAGRELAYIRSNSQPLSVERLDGKIAGVRLALFYVDEALRMAQPAGGGAAVTGAQPDPAREWAEAWLEDHPDARPADVHRAVGVVYGKDEADRVVAAVFRKPLTVADIPAGQGPASLFLRRLGRSGKLVAWYRASDVETIAFMREPEPHAGPAEHALWEHLAATLPTVTAEEGP